MNAELPGRPSTLNGQRAALLLLFAAACGVTPLTNKIDVGTDAFVIGVGEAGDGMTDLFAAPADGGTVYRLTFNRLREQRPRLSESGTLVVFLRWSPVETAEAEPEIITLDLRSMAERGARLPEEAERPTAVAWLRGDTAIALRTGGAIWSLSASASGEFLRLTGADSVRADSALAILLGDPPLASVIDCEGAGLGVCVRTGSGEISVIDSAGSGPLRWGADSIAYLRAGTLAVRPLAGGRPRAPAWRAAPSGFRELTYHGGMPTPTAPRATPP